MLVALTLLVLVEAGLHLAGTAPAYDVGRFGVWRFTDNLRAEPLRGPRDGHAFVVSTNAGGLRTQVPTARTPGRCRIALLGDSTVFGWGVDDGATVADAAEAALAPAAEVLNAGQPGYTTVMAATLFSEAVAAYQPDVTVLFVPMHDTNFALVSDLEARRGAADLPAWLRVTLNRHSRIYALLRRALTPDGDAPFVVPVHTASGDTPTDRSRVPRVSDVERTTVLGDMRAAAAAWGGSVHLGYLPFAQDVQPGPHPRVLDGWMLENAGPPGVADLRSSAVGQTDFVLSDDEGHLSANGNRVTGEALAAWLRIRAGACLGAL